MRSAHHQAKQLECHAFVCQTPENAIVIAATLYQSLLAHMSNSQNERPRKPRNQNGVSCVSIASSSAVNRRPGSISSQISRSKPPSIPLPPPPPAPPRSHRELINKRMAENSMSSDTDNIVRNALLSTSSSSDQRKKKSYKTRRAPPAPHNIQQQGKIQQNSYLYSKIHIDHFRRLRLVQHFIIVSKASIQHIQCARLSSFRSDWR